jgi:hypothetical protein
MKKLLVLVGVLTMASLANATPAFTAISPEPFVIIITAADTANSLDIYLDSTNYIAAGGNPYESTFTSPYYHSPIIILTAANDGFDAYYFPLSSMSNWTPGTELGWLDLNGPGANVGSTPITMDFLDGDTGMPIHTVSVMVPEPATIALLCLGGLMLRRRK